MRSFHGYLGRTAATYCPAALRPTRTLLALGNTRAEGLRVQPEKALAALPEAEKEVKTLARIYGDNHSRILIGSEAREKLVKAAAPRYEIFHFATHGLLDDLNPHVFVSDSGGSGRRSR